MTVHRSSLSSCCDRRPVALGSIFLFIVTSGAADAATLDATTVSDETTIVADGSSEGQRFAQPGISVATPNDLDAAGQMVTVTGAGYQPGQGLYIQFCARPTGTLGTAEGRAKECNPDQTNDQSVWKTPVPATGDFSVQLRVVSAFGDTDCTKVACGVFSRKDHIGGATDFSQDAFASVSFRSAAPPAPVPATNASSAPTAESAASPAPSSGSAATLAVGALPATTRASGAPPALAAANAGTAPSSSAAQLASTGIPTTALAVAALALIVLGRLLIRCSRRSRLLDTGHAPEVGTLLGQPPRSP